MMTVLSRLSERPFGLFLAAIILWMAVRVYAAFTGDISILERFIAGDNDSIMRFIVVQDLWAGQGWYDLHQYRVLPPEGLELHWSRFVDIGMVAVQFFAGLFFDKETASSVVLVIWPTALFAVFLFLIYFFSFAILGRASALFAVFFALIWPTASSSFFGITRIDHHNIQIILAALTLLPIIVFGKSALWAVVSGGAAALSMAIGLEMLPLIAVAGIILLVRSVFVPNPNRYCFLGFTVAFAGFAVILHGVQVPPAEWLGSSCDRLSIPFIGTAGIGVVVAALIAGLASSVEDLRYRIILGLIVSGGGAILAFLTLRSCLVGPYADLPLPLQEIIYGAIIEMQSPFFLFEERAWTGIILLLPVFSVILLATLVYASQFFESDATTSVDLRIVLILFVAYIFLALFLLRIRYVVFLVPFVPILAGYAISALWNYYRDRRGSWLRALALCCGVTLICFGPTFTVAVARPVVMALTGSDAVPVGVLDGGCRSARALLPLRDLPPGRVLSTINLGPPLLLATEHSVLTAPYHRTPDAIANGMLPFREDRAGLLRYIDTFQADYLLLCLPGEYSADSYAQALANGVSDPAFRTVLEVEDLVRVLQVIRPVTDGGGVETRSGVED